MDTYEFEHAQIARELLILNSILIASPQNNLLQKNHKAVIPPIRFSERELVQEYLISSAIKIRIIDDKFRNAKFQVTLEAGEIGEFLDEKDIPTNEILDLREACNKIVHARKFEIQESVGGHHLEPTIILEGIHGRKHWKVELDIQKYVRAGLTFINVYEQHPSIN